MGTEIQLKELQTGNELQAIVPKDADGAYNLAKMIVQGGFAPKGIDTPEKATVAIVAGMEVGLNPMQALANIAVINNRATMWGDALKALVLASGKVDDIKEEITGSGDDMVAICTAQRKDLKSPTISEFSVQDAKTAKLWEKSGPWTQYPKRMLQLRARAFALRDAFPDVLGGIHVREEVEDYQPMRTVNPPAEAVPLDELLTGDTPKVEEPESKVEDAEIVETNGLPEGESLALIEKINGTDHSTFEAIMTEIVADMGKYTGPWKAAVGKALKAKQIELKEANNGEGESSDFPGDKNYQADEPDDEEGFS